MFTTPDKTLCPVICLLGALLCFCSCKNSPTEHYGFITRLGNDTIAVEDVTRQGDELTVDAVDRFPVVRIRHAVVRLDQKGSIEHFVMDINTPSEPICQQQRKVVAEVTNSAVHIAKTDQIGTVKRDFPVTSSIVVAHVQQLYSMYELYFAAALKRAASLHSPPGTPVQLRQFYIERQYDRFPLGRATVTPLENHRIKVQHDWLAGTGEAIMDSAGHLLSYSGEHTTYLVKVNRVEQRLDIQNFAARFTAGETNAGNSRALSVRDTARGKIGDASITVDYGRPLQRGRTLLGQVIPFDQVWRTGANAATQFSTSAPVIIGGISLAPGTYSLWTIPHENGADLIVNRQSGQWGTEYHSSQNLGLVRLTQGAVATQVEKFTISIVPADSHHGMLIMEWGSFKWSVPVQG